MLALVAGIFAIVFVAFDIYAVISWPKLDNPPMVEDWVGLAVINAGFFVLAYVFAWRKK